MPVIPNFSGYAPTPNLASSYLGGARISQDAAQRSAQLDFQRQKLAQDAASDAARLAQAAAMEMQQIEFGREKLAAAHVQNEMELEARQKLYEQKALQEKQEANIEKAYKDTQLGLAERRMKNAESQTKMKLENAARQFSEEQEYRRRVDGGMSPAEAIRGLSMISKGATASIVRAELQGEKPPPMDTIRETIPAEEGKPAVEGSPAMKRSLFGIDWLRRDKPAVEAQPGIPARGAQTITRRIPSQRPALTPPPTMTATNAPPPAAAAPLRELSIPGGLQTAAPVESFPTTEAARKAGKKSGDVIYLHGVGKVRLK